MTHRRRGVEDAVVVPAGAAGSTVTCVRSLGSRGIRTIVTTESSTPATSSRYCDEATVVPSSMDDPEGHTEALLSLARRPDVVTVVPLRESTLYLLAKNRDRFAEHVATPWMPLETVQTSEDWLGLLDIADDVGVPVPETRTLDEYDGWDRDAVIKSRYSIVEGEEGLASPGIRFVPAGAEPDVESVIAEMGHVPIVQEYVPGDGEFGFFALYDGGEPCTTFQHRRVRSYSYAGGASVYRKSVASPQLAAEGTKMLRALDCHGPAMVEFKRDPRDGAFRLMEINPRFWGSLALPVAAGVDLPYLYYRLASGRSVPAVEYETGVGCHFVRGEASYVYSVLAEDHPFVDPPSLSHELRSMTGSLLRQPHFDLLSLADPGPFVTDLLAVAREPLADRQTTTYRSNVGTST